MSRQSGQNSNLPTSASDTYLVGYRAWQFVRPGLLLDMGNTQVLEPRTRGEAFCRLSEHMAPDADCTCGFYAFKTLEDVRAQFGWYGVVLGQIAMWGRVIEHTMGWRSQFIYPLRLYTYEDCAQHKNPVLPYMPYLSDLYGVPFELFTADWAEYTPASAPRPSQSKPLTLEELLACALSETVDPKAAAIANTMAQQRIQGKITRAKDRVVELQGTISRKEDEIANNEQLLAALQLLKKGDR